MPPKFPTNTHTHTHHPSPSRSWGKCSFDELIEDLIHCLVRQLHAQERRRISRDRPRQCRAKAREKRPEPALAVHLADDAANGDIAALGGLQSRLDRVDREHRDPHGYAGRRARTRHSRQAKLAGGFPRRRVHGGQLALDVLVGGEIRRGAGAVAGQGGSGPAKDGAHAALAVELADNVETARVAGFFTRLEFLVLDLENNLDTLEGGGNGSHGDRGEEACGGDLGDGEGAVGGGDGRDGADDVFAYVVTPEGDGDWSSPASTISQNEDLL